MPCFERIRERLPSVYRPDDADPAGDLIPLRSAQLLEINGAPPAGRLLAARGGLVVTLDEPRRINQLRLAPGTAIGSLAAVELYRFANGIPMQMPGAVVRLEGEEARIGVPFEEDRFVLRLKRPGLISLLLWSVSRVLDDLDRDASHVLQSHWVEYADFARFSPYVRRSRELLGEPPPGPVDPVISSFPYIHDLGRIGSLLGLLPWRDPLTHREVVESYRRRILRMVRLYRSGLGTVEALRRMVEVQLPVDEAAPEGLKDLPFTVEEFAPLATSDRTAKGRGPPEELVGPLMRWNVLNNGLEPASPTLFIEGATPDGELVAAAERPLIELFAAGNERVRLGIAYDGDLDPGQTLRIRPAYSSWLAVAGELWRAESLPGEEAPADPNAAGPWSADAGWTGDAANALVQAADRSLWAAVGSDGTLHRFDGESWAESVTGLPRPNCLAVDGDDLLIGTADGLLRLALHPPEDEQLAPIPDPGSLDGPAVHALLRTRSGAWYAGTAAGLARLGPDNALELEALNEPEETAAVLALHEDDSGTLHLGTDLGLFQFQPGLGHWYWYSGEDFSEQVPDWEPYRPAAVGAERNFAKQDRVFLPPVRCVHRGPDAAIWVGTDHGIARYRAHSVGGPSYTVHLEAFPDLAAGAVHTIVEDRRGILWFGTEQGLFRYDGRDWWQLRGPELVRLATGTSAAASLEVARHWRFSRDQGRWEFFDSAAGTEVWTAFTGPSRGTEEEPVRAIAWADGASADLGAWVDGRFIPDPGSSPAALRSRYKPDDTRVVEGGIAALPRLPTGTSTWRYLALETDAEPTPNITPAWTREGRLIPPPNDHDAVEEGRYTGVDAEIDLSHFDEAAFAYDPAATVWMTWEGRRPLTVLARLRTTAAMPQYEPAILDRVWQGIKQVRPAGIAAMLAVDERVVRGRD